MSHFIDLSGQKFGRLSVLEHVKSQKGQTYWRCRCDCGKIRIVQSYHLRVGHTKSCGCLSRERSTIHKAKRTRLYRIWCNMKSRCLNTHNRAFKDYGARGIAVCQEWIESFLHFQSWAVATGYNEHLSLDRKDNNKDYSPENCHWTTMKEQQRNKRNTLYFNGKPLAQIADETGIKYDFLYRRLKKGWPLTEILKLPPAKSALERC